MLSYRHAFHAGNHADMLKHFILYLVLQYYRQKDKPFCYLDTHAGAGLYDLQHAFAQKVGEYQQGWVLLQHAANLDPQLQGFVEHLTALLTPQPHHYCGSPWLAASLLRPQDKAKLFELHPNDFTTLRHHIDSLRRGKQIQVSPNDGYQGLIANLPPACRRAVVLIDPPYESKADYQHVVKTLKAAQQRFASGTYLLWYPLLSRQESQDLAAQLPKLNADNYLQAELTVSAPRRDGFGMFGSGMLVINPPYVLAKQLQDALPQLAQLLAQSPAAQGRLQHKIA